MDQPLSRRNEYPVDISELEVTPEEERQAEAIRREIRAESAASEKTDRLRAMAKDEGISIPSDMKISPDMAAMIKDIGDTAKTIDKLSEEAEVASLASRIGGFFGIKDKRKEELENLEKKLTDQKNVLENEIRMLRERPAFLPGEIEEAKQAAKKKREPAVKVPQKSVAAGLGEVAADFATVGVTRFARDLSTEKKEARMAAEEQEMSIDMPRQERANEALAKEYKAYFDRWSSLRGSSQPEDKTATEELDTRLSPYAKALGKEHIVNLIDEDFTPAKAQEARYMDELLEKRAQQLISGSMKTKEKKEREAMSKGVEASVAADKKERDLDRRASMSKSMGKLNEIALSVAYLVSEANDHLAAVDSGKARFDEGHLKTLVVNIMNKHREMPSIFKAMDKEFGMKNNKDVKEVIRKDLAKELDRTYGFAERLNKRLSSNNRIKNLRELSAMAEPVKLKEVSAAQQGGRLAEGFATIGMSEFVRQKAEERATAREEAMSGAEQEMLEKNRGVNERLADEYGRAFKRMNALSTREEPGLSEQEMKEYHALAEKILEYAFAIGKEADEISAADFTTAKAAEARLFNPGIEVRAEELSGSQKARAVLETREIKRGVEQSVEAERARAELEKKVRRTPEYNRIDAIDKTVANLFDEGIKSNDHVEVLRLASKMHDQFDGLDEIITQILRVKDPAVQKELTKMHGMSQRVAEAGISRLEERAEEIPAQKIQMEMTQESREAGTEPARYLELMTDLNIKLHLLPDDPSVAELANDHAGRMAIYELRGISEHDRRGIEMQFNEARLLARSLLRRYNVAPQTTSIVEKQWMPSANEAPELELTNEPWTPSEHEAPEIKVIDHEFEERKTRALSAADEVLSRLNEGEEESVLEAEPEAEERETMLDVEMAAYSDKEKAEVMRNVNDKKSLKDLWSKQKGQAKTELQKLLGMKNQSGDEFVNSFKKLVQEHLANPGSDEISQKLYKVQSLVDSEIGLKIRRLSVDTTDHIFENVNENRPELGNALWHFASQAFNKMREDAKESAQAKRDYQEVLDLTGATNTHVAATEYALRMLTNYSKDWFSSNIAGVAPVLAEQAKELMRLTQGESIADGERAVKEYMEGPTKVAQAA